MTTPVDRWLSTVNQLLTGLVKLKKATGNRDALNAADSFAAHPQNCVVVFMRLVLENDPLLYLKQFVVSAFSIVMGQKVAQI